VCRWSVSNTGWYTLGERILFGLWIGGMDNPVKRDDTYTSPESNAESSDLRKCLTKQWAANEYIVLMK
jgi:hypothetical protein